jgi:glycosyltransferase involved in cell wall biosynthesis
VVGIEIGAVIDFGLAGGMLRGTGILMMTSTPSSNPSPAISVLMPVYNSERFLHQAVESILSQTVGDFEFICVDDGSTDGSAEILKQYAGRDSRIRVLTRANGGVTNALNAGLVVARGEYVARMDADDVAEPSRFAHQLEYMKNHPECAVVGCWVILMDATGAERARSRLAVTHEQISARLWDGDSSAMPHYGSFIRRDVLTQVDNYREQFRSAQDLDLFLRILEIGRLANVPYFLMHYREHEGSVGARRGQEQARNAREILRQAYERRGKTLPDHLRKWDNRDVVFNRVRWGWQALEQGRYADARKHAWLVLRSRPGRRNSWDLAFNAALGPCRPYLRSTIRAIRRLAR